MTELLDFVARCEWISGMNSTKIHFSFIKARCICFADLESFLFIAIARKLETNL